MTTSVKVTKVYDEIIEFIATGTTPQSVIDFKISTEAKERLDDLVYAHHTGELTSDQQKELDYFLMLEHIMRLAKARAYTCIKTE
jgi:hypothetical protein